MVATERSVCVLSADDISCGNVLYPVITTPNTLFDPDTDGDILITSCALSANPTMPYIYLGTAEGYLLKLDISDLNNMIWIPCQKLHPMGQEMCMLGLIEIEDGGNSLMAESLLYVGESADSQVIGITWDSDKPTTFVLQTLVNRAPLTDWHVLRKNGQPDKIVCCSGQDEHGALHYLSRDIDSTILYTSDADWNGVTKLWCLKNLIGRNHVVASSSYSTRLVLVDNENGIDSDDIIPIGTETPTISADSLLLDDFGLVFIQVTQQKIILHGATGDLLLDHLAPEGFSLLLGTTWTTNKAIHISTCMSDGREHILQVITVSSIERQSVLEITQHHQTRLPSSPSCLYCFDHALLAVGMFNSQVSLYSLDSQLGLAPCQVIDCHDIPHSISTLGTPDHLYLLVGTRSGNLLTFGVSSIREQGSISIFEQGQVRSLGTVPVNLVSDGAGPVYASCECIWSIAFDQDGHLSLEAVHIQGVTTVEAFDLLAPSYDAESSLHFQKLVVVANQRFYVIQVQNKAHIITRKQSLTSTPRRLLLHDHSTSYLITSSNHHGKTYYQLQLIDESGHLLCEHRFDYGETVLCLSKWQVQNKNKVYNYICVGIDHQDLSQGHGNKMRPAQEGNGSLHLYRLKTHKVGGQNSPVQYSIRLAWKNDGLQGGVNTICPHPSGLLFSSGNILHLHQLDMAKGALENITHKTLRFPITSIHVTGDRICVTGYTESVSFYAYDEDTMHLSFLKSDSISRNVQHSLLLNNRTVVGASLSGGMFALMEPGTDSDYYEDSLQTLFCFHYPDIVIKPRCISLRSHHSTEYTAGILSDHLLPWTTNDNKATNHYHQQQCRRSDIQPIVGCTVSGGVIMAYRCSAALFATLDLLQHRLSRYILTQPLLGSVTRYLQWYNQLSGPQVSTIHLDLVSLYLRLTTKQQQQVVRLTDDPGYQYGIDDGMDDNDNRSEKETMTATTLVDLTLALVANGDQYCYKTIPNWTQRPNRNDDLVSWTALTLDLVVTKLEQYYY